MTIYPIITGSITDGVATAISVAISRAKLFEGGYKKESFEIENVIVVLDVRNDIAYVYIVQADSGFIFHPRSNPITLISYYRHYIDNSLGFSAYLIETISTIYGVAGGWSNGSTELSQSYIFPLSDTDHASMLLSEIENNVPTVYFAQPGLYGNLYWSNDDEDNLEVISWKGPPSRHGAVYHEYEIPGLLS